ncbi:hypothetical protein_gp057 [Bacillus phage vB_BceM_WH1]|nr:hypothetical protein_gp057 [Bacillus phage vB_BceM_WH1]
MKKTHKQMLHLITAAGLSVSVLSGCSGYDAEQDQKKDDISQCDPKKDKCEKRERSGGGFFWVPITGSTTSGGTSGATSGSTSGVVSGGGSKASTSSGATSGSTSAPSSGIGNAKAPAGS